MQPFILLWDRLTTPKGIERSEDEQAKIDEKTSHLFLYQFYSCPFCIKVRRQIKRQSLNITLRDAQNDSTYRNELLTGGGEVKVPCLKIVDDSGQVTWMYESDDIINYLQKNYS